MACYWLHQQETTVEIPKSEEVNTITYYNIFVSVGSINWSVLHRYSEFFDLHNILVLDHGVSKDILPPKKVIRNKCPIFIESRRKGLEVYLQYVLNYLKLTMPRVFLEFLLFHQHDIFYLLQTLSSHFYAEADLILSSSKKQTFNPLELHAISECFKSPFPQIEQTEQCYDLCHVLDFCSQLKKLIVKGKTEPYLSSNIIPNKLPIEFSSFKTLESLEILELSLENVQSLGSLRNTVTSLIVHYTDIKTIAQILQCDVLHKSSLENNQVWSAVTFIDLSQNQLTTIDETIKLVPNVETLILSENKITTVTNLSSLSKLKHLYLSNNLISSCTQLHTKIGNILTLDLSQNFITSLEGLSKLYSLETLDLSSNKIVDVDNISCIGDLPCLENLLLTGNSVSTTIDYRIKVLEIFGDRAKDICLDNEKSSQPELDKVFILRALRIVKEGRTPDFNNTSFS